MRLPLKNIHREPRVIDAIILSLFAILITFQPYFMHGEINMYEAGLYLPGINALLHGLVPFRDFFHLRGPFELYMPAALMSTFGVHIAVMFLYFYIGTVGGLIVCVFIGKELYKTRYLLYLMVPVLVGRTFPRVVFTYWGGVRYAFGLFALLCAIKFFKKNKLSWIFWSGVSTALGLFTSIDIGVCAIAGIFAALLCSFIFRLHERGHLVKSIAVFILGILLVAVPYCIYLLVTQSFIPYIDSVYSVLANMRDVLDHHLISVYPRNFGEILLAMVNPVSKNFRHATPCYLYLFLIVYLAMRVRGRRLDKNDLSIICIAVYGLVLYAEAFQSIWAAQFEMALQPEKILLFFMLENAYLYLREQKQLVTSGKTLIRCAKVYGIYFLFLALFMSSVCYSLMRYDRRFFTYQFAKNYLLGRDTERLKPFAHVESRPLHIERAEGLIVPVEQADELEDVVNFIHVNTAEDETIFMYPEMGIYSFFIDRPFLGRFPVSTFSWFNETWHREFISDFRHLKPRFVIMLREMPPNWKKVYLGREENRRRYDEAMDIIRSEYRIIKTTPLSNILRLKN